MIVRVIEQITLSKKILQPGEIVNLPDSLLPRLGGRVEPLPVPIAGDGRDIRHHCPTGNCWCSARLSGNNYPAECIQIKCEHFNIG
jgi:hypothetical protein